MYSRPDRVYGRVSGVCVCGQSIGCPVCAPRIAAFRSAEVATGFERAKALGYEARLTTFTFPHKAGNNLGDEIDAFADAWRKFGSGKMRVVRRKGSLGNIVGREVTYGKSGYHYHCHALRFDLPGTFVEDLHRAGWLAALETIGRRTAGTQERAFHVGEVGDRAQAAYCAKLATAVEAQARAIGSEIASAATKGRNLASLLADAAQGDSVAARVWVEGVAEIVRRKVSSVRWSRGLRAALGCEVDKDDETVAAEEVVDTDVYLGQLTPHQWRGVLTHRAEFALCVAAIPGALVLALACVFVPYALGKGASWYISGGKAAPAEAATTSPDLVTEAANAVGGVVAPPARGASEDSRVVPAPLEPIYVDDRPERPLWVSGWLIRGNKLNVQISDGRVLTEKDPEVAKLERNALHLRGGQRLFMRPPEVRGSVVGPPATAGASAAPGVVGPDGIERPAASVASSWRMDEDGVQRLRNPSSIGKP